MAVVYALKTDEDKYLRQDDNVGELSSSTRFYKKKETARKKANNYFTYSRWAVHILYAKTKPRERVNIGSNEFKELVLELKFNHPFEVVEIELKKEETNERKNS